MRAGGATQARAHACARHGGHGAERWKKRGEASGGARGAVRGANERSGARGAVQGAVCVKGGARKELSEGRGCACEGRGSVCEGRGCVCVWKGGVVCVKGGVVCVKGRGCVCVKGGVVCEGRGWCVKGGAVCVREGRRSGRIREDVVGIGAAVAEARGELCRLNGMAEGGERLCKLVAAHLGRSRGDRGRSS